MLLWRRCAVCCNNDSNIAVDLVGAHDSSNTALSVARRRSTRQTAVTSRSNNLVSPKRVRQMTSRTQLLSVHRCAAEYAIYR